MAYKRIFITGGSSFLGKEIISLLKNNYELVLLEHKQSFGSEIPENIKIVRGGMENVGDWQKNLSAIDIILHLAAVTHATDEKLYEKINADGTRKLVLAAEKEGVKRFVFISTRAIGEKCGSYGASKEKAEKYLKDSGLDYTILRISEVYDDNFTTKEGLGALANQIKKRLIVPYLADDSVTLAPIHIKDVLDGILVTLKNEVTSFKTYALAGPESLCLRETAERILRYFKLKRWLLPIPLFFAKHSFFIASKIFKTLPPDQFQRFLCEKESLSDNVTAELGVKPRSFLIS